jgi:hypothetical protein
LAAGALGDFLPPDPTTTVTTSFLTISQACSGGTTSAACYDQAKAYLNQARALAGLGPYDFPADFDSLPPGDMLLIVVDEDRIAYGGQPIAGLASVLDSDAQIGMSDGEDPPAPSGAPPGVFWASEWAGGFPNILYAYLAWMWQDGYPSANADCTSPTSSGCWGHRHGFFLDESSPNVVMGTSTGTINGSESSDAAIVVDYRGNALPALEYTWTQALADGAGQTPTTTSTATTTTTPTTTTPSSTTPTSTTTTTAAPTPATVPSGSSSSGGGGGGAPPNLNVTISPSVSGGNVSLTVLIGNNGGVAFSTVLTVTTSGLSGVGSTTLWGFGAGCSTSGTTTTCQLVNLPTGAPVPVAIIGGTLTGSSASAAASLGQTNLPDTDTSDDTATWSYSPPSSTAPPADVAAASSTPKSPAAAKTTVELIVTANPHGKVVLTPKGESLRSVTGATKHAPAVRATAFVFSPHSTVSARAVVDHGYEFVRWTGSACSGTKPVCVIRNLTSSRSIGFAAKPEPRR